MTKLSTERKNKNSQKADCVHPNVALSVVLENKNELILKITIFILHSRELRTFTDHLQSLHIMAWRPWWLMRSIQEVNVFKLYKCCIHLEINSFLLYCILCYTV